MIRMKRSVGDIIFTNLNIFLMIIISIVCIYPLFYVLIASLSDPLYILRHRGFLLYPQGFNLESYKRVLENPMIGVGYLNTMFYLTVGTALNLVLTSLGAYVLSRKGVMLKNFIMFVIVFTMFFSGGLIPLFLVVMKLNMLDTRWSVIIPVAINTWNLIIMRTAFLSIPESIEESVKMDGANDFTILLKIILPLSLPVVAVIVLFSAVERWNAWFNASIFLQKRELYPLQIVLREILIVNSTDTMTTGMRNDQNSVGETIKYSTIIIATLPILFVYPFLQKYFVKGVMIGALKE